MTIWSGMTAEAAMAPTGLPPDGDTPSSCAHEDRTKAYVRGHSVETELVALDVLHHEARLVVAISKQ
jgi:hypothetical protein